MHRRKNSRLFPVVVVLLGLIWGLNWPVMKIANQFFPPVLFAALRYMVGALALLPFHRRHERNPPGLSEIGWTLLTGVLQIGVTNFIIQISLNYLRAGLASLLFFTMPLWFIILAHFFMPDEKMNVPTTVGLAFGILGLAFVLGFPGSDFLDEESGILYSMLVLLAAVCWAVASLIVKKKLAFVPPLRYTMNQMAFASLSLFLFSILYGETWRITIVPEAFAVLTFSGVIASSLAFFLWFFLLRSASVSAASVSLFLTPLFGILAGWVFLKERLAAVQVVGVFLVILSIGVVTANTRRRQPSLDQA